jgi:hypothetical protein
VSSIQEILTQAQIRLQVLHGRRLTHRDLAKLAHTSERTIAEWMRGATSPMAMRALLHLLSQLPPEHAAEVLALWRQKVSADSNADAASAATLDAH